MNKRFLSFVLGIISVVLSSFALGILLAPYIQGACK